ncbi:hypothetical protein V6N12_010927 [Hibiscus sabdariffa]|uniref:Uncharacterized protein n=1 Tax=Hibiscus sabdariffa TaxID=183260 RepID=A0ABR2EN79_9ROSI
MEQKMGMEDGEVPELSGGKSKSHEGIESPNGLAREEKLPGYAVNEVLSGSISKQTVLKEGPNSGMGLSSKAINQELNEENNIVDQTNIGFSSPVDKGELSNVEKKRRDRGVRRTKKTKEGAQKMELSSCSLSDSDLRNKWEWAKIEAKLALELGKKYGLLIRGSEDEAVRELSLLEFC